MILFNLGTNGYIHVPLFFEKYNDILTTYETYINIEISFIK